MTSTLILNAVLAAAVFVLILGTVVWAIATGGRDRATMIRRAPRRQAQPVARARTGQGHGRRLSAS